MDYLDFFNIYIIGSLETLISFYFFIRFLQKKIKVIHYILFLAFSTSMLAIFKLEGISAVLAFILCLIIAGNLLEGVNFISTILYAVVIMEIMNLCFGLCNSLSYILFPIIVKEISIVFGFIFMVSGNILALVLSFVCYKIILKCCIWNEAIDRKYIFMILLPVFLIFLVSEYININIYGNIVKMEKNQNISSIYPYQILFMQLLGIISLFCIMFAYKKLIESFQLNKETALLEQRAHFLNQYVLETKLRYEKTTSFRHDIKNHMILIKELLENKKIEEVSRYIEEMQELTKDMSFPVSTNHPILDILIGNKLGIARDKGIEVKCSMIVPYPCEITDMDFCIILGNALDNAIAACEKIENEKQKYIHITGRVQEDFLFIEIKNNYIGKKIIHYGTGLDNIKMVVEKYHGAMEIKTEFKLFILSILLIIPQQSKSTS